MKSIVTVILIFSQLTPLKRSDGLLNNNENSDNDKNHIKRLKDLLFSKPNSVNGGNKQVPISLEMTSIEKLRLIYFEKSEDNILLHRPEGAVSFPLNSLYAFTNVVNFTISELKKSEYNMNSGGFLPNFSSCDCSDNLASSLFFIAFVTD